MSGDEHAQADEQADEQAGDGPGADEPEEAEAQEPEAPTWFDMASQTTCPACGAVGAVMLGEGVFCPTCGEVSTPRSSPP